MEWFFTSALNLTFSPGEKEQPQAGSGFADDCPANPVAGFAERRRIIHPLLEERAGVRTDVKLNCYGQAGKPGIKSKS
jgi:hypothetical protein